MSKSPGPRRDTKKEVTPGDKKALEKFTEEVTQDLSLEGRSPRMCQEGRESPADTEDNLSVLTDGAQGKRLGHVTRNTWANLVYHVYEWSVHPVGNSAS